MLSQRNWIIRFRLLRGYDISPLWVKPLKRFFFLHSFQNDLEGMQKNLFSSNSFHQMFSLCSPKARAAASSASFSCIKSVCFLQPLSYSWTTKHTNRFVLAHTAFSRAYKINSVRSLYRLACLRTNTHITTHGHCFLAQCFSPSLPPCLTSIPRRSSGALPC